MLEAGMQKRWRLYDPDGQDGALAQQLQVHLLMARLLRRRGICDVESARQFLAPKMTMLHDPALMPGADRAARRLTSAVAADQPIVIYGDYDVDGITASAILWHTLKLAGARVSTYVPHRIEEGYGLNSAAIEQLAAQSAHGKPLIVSVDCGITAVEPALIASKAGVELIITDHHEFNAGELPQAYEVVHPRLPGSAYPFGSLCGAGVALKLAWQFAKIHCGSERLPAAFRDLLVDLMSLAALGTIADVMPLVDENRVIVTHGLGQIKRTGIAGLNALIDVANLRGEKIDAHHVGFILGPRLNACGRMGHAQRAVELLTTADPDEAAQTARFLTRENDRRRATELAMFHEAKQMVLDAGYDQPDCRAIVLSKADWHAGVIGVVASRLVDTFARPVILLSVDHDHAQGSARSVRGVSVHEALAACAKHLTSYGGHAMAAGLQMDSSHIDRFREDIVSHVNQRFAPEDLVPVVDVDATCTLEDLNLPLMDQLMQLAPFGRENPSPRFCLRRVRLEQPSQPVGKQRNHLRLMLRQQDRVMPAIAFGMGHLADALPAGVCLDVVFEPRTSTWQGTRRVDLHVQDVKLVSG